MTRPTVPALLVALVAASTTSAEEGVLVSGAKKGADGFLVHEVRSPYQAKVTLIRVLLPDRVKKGTA